MEAIFLLQLKNALMLGCQYALIAIGFTLFFGVLNVVVFCHGDFAYVALFIATALISVVLGINFGTSFLRGVLIILFLFVAMAFTGFIGVVVERVIIRPLRTAPSLMPLLITAATGIFLEQVLKNFYPQGSNPQTFPLDFDRTVIRAGGFDMSVMEILILVITLFLFLFMFYFIKKTRIGAQIEAISQDFEAASMMGINVNRGISITFFIGASLAAIAGFMNGMYYSVFRYDMGAMAGIKGFSASVVGGLGSIFGAIMGGFLMAFVETFASAYIPGASQFRDVFSFLVVLLFLIFRPSGILGEQLQEKV
ncbi:MAG: branched-chain amino acid ABC transporter permease [Spirochaetes bacterium]|nr:MAG: branched-chain amino acid ABC transporter permease [Spirochaetota bacterium]